MKMSDRNRRIVALALPSIVSNLTVPLLGLMDVAIVGHLGRASYIGAIAVGGMLFSMIYWGFGFLRMGTSGLTSQALGRRNLEEVMTQFLRAQGVAQAIALARRNGAVRMFLEVRESNARARKMYTSFGFEETGRRKNYYPTENGREDAILMTAQLSRSVPHD